MTARRFVSASVQRFFPRIPGCRCSHAMSPTEMILDSGLAIALVTVPSSLVEVFCA